MRKLLTNQLLPSQLHNQTRRQFLKRSGLLASAGAVVANGLWLPSHAYASTASAVVETDKGKVKGYIDEGISVYKGIPYGANTGGANRFKPPRPAVAWKGVLEAVKYGPIAPQSIDASGALNAGESEDCLKLNVWTPEPNSNKKRPVMFWCHGGGFTTLSSSTPNYDGTNLAIRGDVVVVTINHRLNTMGFTHMESQGGEDFAGAGAAGMLDLVAGLKWVQRNIEQFGGDPERVMIFGESGGGRKVGTLLAMPAAKGLFHRAVIQSGPSLRLVSETDGAELAQKLMNKLGLKKGDMRALQALDPGKIIAAYQSLSQEPGFQPMLNGFAPVVDGITLPASSFHPTASTANPDVPLIVGANRTEMTLFLRGNRALFSLDDAGLMKSVAGLVGANKAKDVIEVYKAAQPKASPSEVFFLIASDHRYVAPCTTIAERRSDLKTAPVYSYYLTWATNTFGGSLMTPHALDIPFVFDNTETEHTTAGFTTGTEEERALAAKVSSTWIEFARSGNPNAGTLPTWKPFTRTQRNTMVINNNSENVIDPIASRREIMQDVLGLS
ncbi:carboxylesterase/lipase family protein [Aurantivibrio plasticivorans]